MIDKMSLEEKIGQMTQVTIDMILKDHSTTEEFIINIENLSTEFNYEK